MTAIVIPETINIAYGFTAEEDARVDVIILADENSGLLYPSCSISNSQKGSETA